VNNPGEGRYYEPEKAKMNHHTVELRGEDMTVTRIRPRAAWQVLTGLYFALLGIVPAMALADSAGEEDSPSRLPPRQVRVDAVCKATPIPARQAEPTGTECAPSDTSPMRKRGTGNELPSLARPASAAHAVPECREQCANGAGCAHDAEGELSSEFLREVQELLRELDGSQLSTTLRILPAAFRDSGVESRITDRADRDQIPTVLADLAEAGRVCKIVRVGPESTPDATADASEDEAGSAPGSKELPRGYKITAVLDATDSIDPTQYGLPKSTRVAAVRLVPVARQRPPLRRVGKSTSGGIPIAAVTAHRGAAETGGDGFGEVGRPAPSTIPDPADTSNKVREVSFVQAQPDASETPDPAAGAAAADDNAETTAPLADDAGDRPNQLSPELGFPRITDVTIDISTRPDPGVTDESLQQPEGQAAEVFLAHGEVRDIPRVGGVGLDEGLFLESGVFCHQPLYFEEANLERYGNSYCRILQPVLSGYRFFASVPAMPYMMAVYRPRKCYYDSSPYLPGRAAPRHDESLPLNVVAGATELNAITALIFLFPP